MSDAPIPLHPPESGPDGPGPAGPPSPFSSPRSWMLMVPVIFGSMLLLSGLGWFVAVRNTAGVANGPKVDVTFDSTCAAVVIGDRLAEYGLPGTWEGPVLHLTLAGTPGEDAVPAALAAPGKLALVSDGAEVPFEVLNAAFSISLQGAPVAIFTMKKDLPAGDLHATLDGAEMEIESVNGNELMLASRAETSVEAVRNATDWFVQVKHPLPCDVRVLSVAQAVIPPR